MGIIADPGGALEMCPRKPFVCFLSRLSSFLIHTLNTSGRWTPSRYLGIFLCGPAFCHTPSSKIQPPLSASSSNSPFFGSKHKASWGFLCLHHGLDTVHMINKVIHWTLLVFFVLVLHHLVA